MIEIKILAAFLKSRKEYESARQYVKGFSPMGKAMIRGIDNYYEADPSATQVDAEVLDATLRRQFAAVPKHAREFEDYLVELHSVDVSAVNVTKEVLEAERDRIGMLLADAILTKNTDMISTYLREYETVHDTVTLEESDDDTYTGAALDVFENIYEEGSLIKIAPSDLNKRLRGGLIRGMHLLIAAMPEAGKSLVALNMTAGFIRQGLRVLYVGNEDPIPELILRLLSNLSGVSGDELFTRKDFVMEKAFAYGYDLVTFKGLDPGSIEAIDSLLRKGEYDVLVIDQLRNLESRNENNTLRLEAVAKGARNLARRHNVLVVSVTQAAESARDRLVLNSGDIDGSNIGIPGACDVMVMVGMNDDYYQRDLRRVSLVKNKRGGIHDNFTVSINRSLSRIRNYNGLGELT